MPHRTDLMPRCAATRRLRAIVVATTMTLVAGVSPSVAEATAGGTPEAAAACPPIGPVTSPHNTTGGTGGTAMSSYTIGSEQSSDGVWGASIALNLQGDPQPSTLGAAYWVVEWTRDATNYFAAYEVDSISSDAPSQSVDAANPTATKKKVTWHLGVRDAKNGYVDSTSGDIAQLRKDSSVTSDHVIHFKFPYGDHANAAFRITGSSAKVWESGAPFPGAPLVPYPFFPITPSAQGSQADALSPADVIAESAGGRPFCGEAIVVQSLQVNDAPLPGQVTLLSQSLPNYFYFLPANTDPGHAEGGYVDLWSDPVNHLVFENNMGSGDGTHLPPCPDPQGSTPTSIVSYSLDTYGLISRGCPSVNTQAGGQAPGQEFGRLHAVDSADRVIFTGGPGFSVAAVSEDTLRLLTTFPLPTGASTVVAGAGHVASTNSFSSSIQGMTWDATASQLIVQVGNGQTAVSLQAINISHDSSGALAGTASWGLPVTACTNFMTPNTRMGGVNPGISQGDKYAFVGCNIGTLAVGHDPVGTQAGGTNGMVKISLTGACAPQPSAVLAVSPAGGSASLPGSGCEIATPAPAAGAADFLFDQTSDRAFFPLIAGGGAVDDGGITTLVYEGCPENDSAHSCANPPAFIGRAATGDSNDQLHLSGFALDANTGRMYDYALGSGLTLLDGRRTP
ncbi:MAG: hypothetical protein ACYDGR_06690, partial [Candidatus Dormibacteria bacterium]